MEQKNFLKLSDIESYRIAFHLSNFVWEAVIKWDSFSKRTVGCQFAEAVDSIQQILRKVLVDIIRKIKLNFIGTARDLYWNH